MSIFDKEVRTEYSGKRLYMNFTIQPIHEMNVYVDIENKRECNAYLMSKIKELDELKSQILKEASRYIEE